VCWVFWDRVSPPHNLDCTKHCPHWTTIQLEPCLFLPVFRGDALTIIFFWLHWGLNSGPHTCQETLPWQPDALPWAGALHTLIFN
jgi:hypothetical protein